MTIFVKNNVLSLYYLHSVRKLLEGTVLLTVALSKGMYFVQRSLYETVPKHTYVLSSCIKNVCVCVNDLVSKTYMSRCTMYDVQVFTLKLRPCALGPEWGSLLFRVGRGEGWLL